MAIAINTPLKAGFIFIQSEETGNPYICSRMGGLGYFSRLDPSSVNGHVPISPSEYLAA
jgi:hypothetical protein